MIYVVTILRDLWTRGLSCCVRGRALKTKAVPAIERTTMWSGHLALLMLAVVVERLSTPPIPLGILIIIYTQQQSLHN